MTWDVDRLDRIGAAQELQISSCRPDGSLRRWALIRVVRVDDVDVRSAYGRAGGW